MKKRMLHLLAPTLLLLAAMLAGCNKDETDVNQLPDGKHPLTLTAAVEGLTATRATGKDAWAGNEEIAISVDEGATNKQYSISDAASGNLTPVDANNQFYWTNRTMQVSAWFPVDFKIENIQDQTDADKYKKFDFLHTTQNVVFKGDTPLKFKHRMAKVSVTLKAGGGLTDDELENASVKIFGYTAADIDPAAGIVTGTADPGDWITPLQEGNACFALLVPQASFPAGEKFISITLSNDDTYYYKPLPGDGNTLAGTVSNYSITVHKTGLSVAVSRWQAGQEVEGADNENPYTITITITGEGMENIAVSNATSLGNNTFTYSLSEKEMPVLTFHVVEGKGVSVDMDGTVNAHMEYDVTDRTFKYTLDIHSDLHIRISQTDYLSELSVGNYIYPDGKCTAVPLANEAAGIVYKIDGNTAYGVAMKSDGKFSGGFELYQVIKNHTPKIDGCDWKVDQ